MQWPDAFSLHTPKGAALWKPAQGAEPLGNPRLAIGLRPLHGAMRVGRGESRLRARPKGFPIALWKPSDARSETLIEKRYFIKLLSPRRGAPSVRRDSCLAGARMPSPKGFRKGGTPFAGWRGSAPPGSPEGKAPGGVEGQRPSRESRGKAPGGVEGQRPSRETRGQSPLVGKSREGKALFGCVMWRNLL